MLMNSIPMDHLVALAEQRRYRLLAEAENHRLARRLPRRTLTGLVTRLLRGPGPHRPGRGEHDLAG
ncbi:hypothetical protein [Pseudonocardia phyllosphaerae]|uniref:hypothetical protein n=1 Tax=Pseudonocardia phyllosphaerae TaxID=3390502 RepID=UPI0039792756